MNTNPLLKVRDLKAGYFPGSNVLDGINLDICEGDIVAVIGQNGSGKSTLAKTIMRLIPYSQGSITFMGNECNKAGVTTSDIARQGIGYFIQEGKVFPNLTVEENLAFTVRNLDKSQRRDRIVKIKGYFDLLSDIKRMRMKASYLSGGEKHQLSLAMVLLTSPRLIILDEPSAGLSPINRKAIFDVITAISAEFKVGILLIEQNVIEALRIADKVELMKLGEKPLDWHTQGPNRDNPAPLGYGEYMNRQTQALAQYLTASIINDINHLSTERLTLLSDNVLDLTHIELLRENMGLVNIDSLYNLICMNDFPLFLYELIPVKSPYKTEIIELMRRRWATASSIAEKYHILFRISDFIPKDDPLTFELIDFVISNYSEFCKRASFWLGSSSLDPFEFMTSRISDVRFPPSKAWLYILYGSTSVQRKGAFTEFVDKLKESKTDESPELKAVICELSKLTNIL